MLPDMCRGRISRSPWMPPSSELYNEKTGMYHFPGESKLKGEEVLRDTGEMISYYERLVENYPIISIEDGLDENDWDGWQELTKRSGRKSS